MMKLRLAAPEHLVDLRRAADLKTISESSGEIHIGAMATHYDLQSLPRFSASAARFWLRWLASIHERAKR